MTIETVKGFRDYTGEEAVKRSKVKEIIENTFLSYGFEPAETPIIEYEEFVRGNNTNDEAVSDIFKLEDRGKRKLALRYEFTFQLKRIMQNKKIPYRRYQIGPVFRDEPTSESRFRQFIQCDIDTIGSSIKDEAEILKTVSDILTKLKIDFIIYINNRKLLNEILEELEIKEKEKVIREIDKLDKLDEKEVKENLRKYNAESILSIFKKPESYFEKYESYGEIKELKKYIKLYNFNAVFQPALARGLSYYNGTIFEAKSKKMKETLFGGGSYIFNGIQCFGYGSGLDRLSILANIPAEINKVLIISLNQDKKAIEISDKLRNINFPATIMYGKPGKALDYANSYQIKYVIFVGDEEIKKKKLKIKDMASGKEKLINEKQLEKEIKNLK